MKKIYFLPFILIFAVQSSFGQSWMQVGTYSTGSFDEGAAEIVCHDPGSQRLFFSNAESNSITALDFSNPTNLELLWEIDLSEYGNGVNSIDVHNGTIAVAVEADPRQEPGSVVFFDTAGQYLNHVIAGALPDMLVFSNDGLKVLVANEGEPNDDYDNDPVGSVTIIDLSEGVENAHANHITFEEFNDRKQQLINKGVRIFGPNATVAQDLEPEYISIWNDSLAYVALQENNAFAVINIPNQLVVDILPLGYKDHYLGSAELTGSWALNELEAWPTLGHTKYDSTKIQLGGFSALFYDSKHSADTSMIFYTVPDRGPNDAPINKDIAGTTQNLRPFKLPDYQGQIVKLELNTVTNEISLTERIYLTDTTGIHPITGKGNFNNWDEVPVTQTDDSVYVNIDYTIDSVNYHQLDYDPLGGDMEGVIIDNDGNFWLCDENRPAIYKFQPNGKLIERFIPTGTAVRASWNDTMGYIGEETLPAAYNNKRANRGFEGLAFDYDNNIVYAFIQTPIYNPDASVKDRSDVIRMIGLDANSGIPVSEYVYLLEQNRNHGLSVSRVDKIGDASYTGNGKFLVLERDSGIPGMQSSKKFVYEIDLRGATNILGMAVSDSITIIDGDTLTLEQMTADQILSTGIHTVFKRKMLNLPDIGYFPSDKPEGIAYINDSTYFVLNDNDFGLNGAGVSDLSQLGAIGFKRDYGIDSDDRSGSVDIAPTPVLGMYLPDAIKVMDWNGNPYILTANEGDARDYDGFSEEERVEDIQPDPTSFAGKSELLSDRLNITTTLGDIDGDGQYEYLYSYGARSFSAFDAYGNQVFDSGEDLEQITYEYFPENFNSDNTENESLKNRSDNKGPEPEAICIGEYQGEKYVLVGLERMGGIVIYKINSPSNFEFVDYINNRNFDVPLEDSLTIAGDLAPEDIKWIHADDSPTGQPYFVVANEVSGSVTVYGLDVSSPVLNQTNAEKRLIAWPNPVHQQLNLNKISDYDVYDVLGKIIKTTESTNRINFSGLQNGIYFIKDIKTSKTIKVLKN